MPISFRIIINQAFNLKIKFIINLCFELYDSSFKMKINYA
jgi:hypothetical protein